MSGSRGQLALATWICGTTTLLWIVMAWFIDPDLKLLEPVHWHHVFLHSLPAALPAWAGWNLFWRTKECEGEREPWWIQLLSRAVALTALLYAWGLLLIGILQLAGRHAIIPDLIRLAISWLPSAAGWWVAMRMVSSDPMREVPIAGSALLSFLGLVFSLVAVGVYLSVAGWVVGFDTKAVVIGLSLALLPLAIAGRLLGQGAPAPTA